MRAERTRHARRPGHALARLLLSVLMLGGPAPAIRADSEQLDDRDRSVDWAIGGLERGSRLPGSTAAPAPAGSRRAPGSSVSPADTGAARPSLGPGATGVGVRGAGPGGGPVSRGSAGPSGQGGLETSQPPSGGGEKTSGGETTESGLGIHVETETSGGNLNAGVEVETPWISLEAGTGLETGTEAETTTSGTDLVGSADLTAPAAVDTTTTTELDSTLTGGGDDASVESDSTEGVVGDNADDCALLGLIACPSFP